MSSEIKTLFPSISSFQRCTCLCNFEETHSRAPVPQINAYTKNPPPLSRYSCVVVVYSIFCIGIAQGKNGTKHGLSPKTDFQTRWGFLRRILGYHGRCPFVNWQNESSVQHLFFFGLPMEIKRQDFGLRITWADEQKDIGDVCQVGYKEKKT